MSKFQVLVENCNSIDRAEIEIEENSLNIKYGPNGIGKSTIAKAIIAGSNEDALLGAAELMALTPFKHKDQDGGALMPSVSGIDDIKSVLSFDEDYVNQFIFQKDEVVKNSFNIFIKTENYDSIMTEIEELFSGIQKAFQENEDIENTIHELKQLRDAFNISSSGKIAKTSKVIKAYQKGNKLENIPEALKLYEPFLKSKSPSTWITWQKKGNTFLDLSDNCPYCSSDLSADKKKETVKAVEKEYDSKSVEHLNNLEETLDKLGNYFTETCKSNLKKITKENTSITEVEETFLKTLLLEISALISKFENLKWISFYKLQDTEGNKMEDKLRDMTIDLNMIGNLNSENTSEIVKPINEKLEELISKVGTLKGKIGIQKAEIKKSINKNKEQINDFLRSAGYRYYVDIFPEGDSYKMKLIHQDGNEHIELASQHLSYGEKNAFSLILFMYQALRENPDLVILDDPISSFDKNKKYAIIHKLFRGKESFRGMTILMLTHDIEPAIDMIRIKGTSDQYQSLNPSAHFLRVRSGVVTEVPIARTDIQTFASICMENITSIPNDIIKIIYLRRHYEIIDDRGNEYNLLASLLHGRDAPTVQDLDGQTAMSGADASSASDKIKEYISDFDYQGLLVGVKDADELRKQFSATDVGYEKIQLFRIIPNVEHDNDVIKKFVNETFHIENEYVMQLNPQKFDTIPEYIIEECEKVLEPVAA